MSAAGAGRRTTLRDVAHAAGVSVATASAATSGRTDARIPDATRERIRAAAAALGYRANPQARAMRTGRSDLVLLSLHMLADPWSLAVAEAVQAEGARHGLTTLIAPDGDWQDIADRVAPDVVLVDSPAPEDRPRLERMVERGLRVVVFTDDADRRVDGADVIVSDATPGAALVVDHLAARTDDVACLTSTAQLAAHEAGATSRVTAYVRAVERGAVGATRIAAFRASETDAFETALQLLSTAPPRALYCTTDFAALAAIRAAQTLGLHVPRDLLVAGLGMTLAGARSVPSLTTAGPDDSYARIARIVVDASREPAAPATHLLEWRLHARASTDGAPA